VKGASGVPFKDPYLIVTFIINSFLILFTKSRANRELFLNFFFLVGFKKDKEIKKSAETGKIVATYC